jgi:hypothetical protein
MLGHREFGGVEHHDVDAFRAAHEETAAGRATRLLASAG